MEGLFALAFSFFTWWGLIRCSWIHLIKQQATLSIKCHVQLLRTDWSWYHLNNLHVSFPSSYWLPPETGRPVWFSIRARQPSFNHLGPSNQHVACTIILLFCKSPLKSSIWTIYENAEHEDWVKQTADSVHYFSYCQHIPPRTCKTHALAAG